MSSAPPQRYPLDWPIQYPRTGCDDRVRCSFRCSLTTALDELLASLERRGIDQGDIVISTNVPTRLDGLPRANVRHDGDDTGAAVYWRTPSGQTMCMACDLARVSRRYQAAAKAATGSRGSSVWRTRM